MEGSFRFSDPLFRFGGEEFVVLLHSCSSADAHTALDRFRSNIENYDFPGVGRVTVSIGCCLYGANELPTTVIDRADQALYYAKEHGRNQVVDFEAIKDKLDQPDAATDVELF